MEYELTNRPPMGIMSRFIVKTHHMIVKTPEHPKGVYWHNGVFLGTGEEAFRSEALCEFDPERRKLRIEVRAAFPQSMCEQIHGYVQAVFSFFSGLKAERSYGCIIVDSATGTEARCDGLHTEKRIYTAILRQRATIDCEFEDHEIDPRVLVGGLGSFSDFILTKVVSVEQLRPFLAPYFHGVKELLDWVSVNDGKMDLLVQGQAALSAEFKQEAELKLHEYLALTSELLDNREFTAAPGLISITTKNRTEWSVAAYFKETYVLTPFCECDGNIHACEDGRVEFTKDQDWWEKTAPWIARGTKFLSTGLQLAFAGMPLALGNDVFDAVKEDVKFMGALTKHMELKAEDKEDLPGIEKMQHGEVRKDLRTGDPASKLTRAALAQLLKELAPDNYSARIWGALRRVQMGDASYRWLCEDCAARSR